uniref:Uncharacterized protein n=1 Tax=Phlebotomus papatasi TaxID=29031 RepID=A0A1B0F054_PHLPP
MMPIQDDLDKCNNNGGNDGHSGTSGNSSNTDGGHNQHIGVQSSSAVTPTPTMTKAELRKSNKPIMEKKRRARINHCLNELKTLILEAMKKDVSRITIAKITNVYSPR